MPLAQSAPERKRLTVECRQFRPFQKNTLVGFADIFIRDMQLVIRDISLHQKNAARWASLPARPMVLKDGSIAKDETTGKAKFIAILEFASRDVSTAFSSAVIAAVLAHSPNAFGKPV